VVSSVHRDGHRRVDRLHGAREHRWRQPSAPLDHCRTVRARTRLRLRRRSEGTTAVRGSNLLVSLLSFNIGIEIGQLAVLCVFVPALALLFRGAMAGRMGIIVVSALVAHTAWHWMLDRADVLWRTPWPPITVPGLMVLAQWIIAVGVAVGAAKLLAKWIERKWPGHLLPAESRVEG
jgi:hypothetical protein